MIEVVTCFPNEGTPAVINKTPSTGDIVRVTEGSNVTFAWHTEPPAPPSPPEFKTLTSSQYLALLVGTLGFARADSLLKANGIIEALILKAERIDRDKGNTPAAIAYLKTVFPSPLTDVELGQIEDAWRAL